MIVEKTITTKEKLTTILLSIIRRARAGAKVEAKALSIILSEENFDKRIKEKLKIFDNVPEESKMFSIMYDTAKRSLGDLKRNVVNTHAFELVKLFYTLDENFKRKLFSQEFIEKEYDIKDTDNEQKTFCQELKEKIVVQKQKEFIEIPEGITGHKFLLSKLSDEKSFDDLNQALNNL